MSFKITISNKDFLEVLKSTKVLRKLGKNNIENELVEFTYEKKILTIIVVGASRLISCKGRGKGTALIPLLRYQALQKVPPHADPLQIEFNEKSGTLVIGTTLQL